MVLLQAQSNGKAPINVRTFGRNFEGFFHLHNQVRCTPFPAFPNGGRDKLDSWIPLRHFGLHPVSNQVDLLFGKGSLAFESAPARCRRPGRHQASSRDARNQPTSLRNIAVSQEREGRRLVRPMANRTVLENDRGNVLAKGNDLSGRSQGALRQARQRHNAEESSQGHKRRPGGFETAPVK